jgi:putative DNA methylase
MSDKRRLIEVAFPLKQASLASVHEKSVRQGHISTLHIWPARRPLAAARAALLATLLPDPEDPVKRQELLDRIGGKVVKKHVKETDDDGNTVAEDKEVVEGGVLAWGQETAPQMDEFRELIRIFFGDTAPKVLDPFAGGGAIPLEAMRLGCDVTASDLNPVAWLILKCTLDYPQQFAGKKWHLPEFVRQWPDFIEDFLVGKIKKRKGGKNIHFSDARQLQLIELPEADLAWHVRAWGRWVLERSRADLAVRYPVVSGEPTVAYLWARTVRDKVTAGRIPLLKTFWLSRKKGRKAALLPVPNDDGTGVSFRLLYDKEIDNPERTIAEHPFLRSWEVTAAGFEDFLKTGTMNRAGVWSPMSGRPGMIALTMDDLRRQGQQGLFGTQLTAVVVEATQPNSRKTVKRYRLPTAGEQSAADVQIEDLDTVFADLPFGVVDEPLPPVGTLGFRIPLYGFTRWREIFTPRQLLALGTIAKHSRDAAVLIAREDKKAAEAIAAYLGMTLDRVADRCSTICTWTVNWDKIRNTFGRFALPMTWDFVEGVATAQASGGYPGQNELVAQFIEHSLALTKIQVPVAIERRSAIETTDRKYDAIVTDPPYYGAIPYSDLMDFFYIWLRRTQFGFSASTDSAFKETLSPKWNHEKADGELIDDESRFGGDRAASKAAYESGMARAFHSCCESLTDSGRLVVVFANKEVDAWETLIGALIRGGAVVTASWPIQTEMPNRVRGVAAAALSTSVWIVCRKRPQSAIAGWDERVTQRMKEILYSPRLELADRNILQYYFDLGIRGPDLIWAALGPALEAYSAHPLVKKTAGGVMTVPEFLKEVRKLVLQFSLGELPGFRDVQQETQGRGETMELDSVTQYYLLHRAYFGLEPAPAGACILYANACGKNETELKVVWNVLEQGGKTKRGRPKNDAIDSDSDDEASNEESSGNEYRLLNWEERTSREDLGELRSGQPAPLIDRLHRLMYLFQQNHVSEVQHLYEGWGLSNERAFKPLLQAVRELALRDKNDTERRIVEALATQLRMNRKTVIIANEPVEVPLFTDADEDTLSVSPGQSQKE